MTSVSMLPHPTALRRAERPAFDRVVLGIDFESPSLAAARWATEHVAPGAHAIIAHVAPLPEPAVERADDIGRDASRLVTPLLEGGLAGLASTLGVASHRIALRVGRASRWLSEIANGAEASLIVLGRRKDANRSRVGEPNVIERVVRRSSTSALVVPEGATARPAHVIAAVDESRHAASVVQVALRLARSLACPLTIVHVLSPISGAYDRLLARSRRRRSLGAGDDEASTATRLPSRLPTRTARWLVGLLEARRHEPSVSVEVAVGDPAREIAARALAVEGAMIVVGQRGADEAPPGSLGSVARELLTRAPVPVLAVAGA